MIRRFLASTLFVLFTVSVVGLAPHLVHHVFDKHEQTHCPFAAAAEHQQAILVSAVTLLAVGLEAPHAVAAIPALRAVDRAVSDARAPPVVAS